MTEFFNNFFKSIGKNWQKILPTKKHFNTLSPDHVYIRFAFYRKSPYLVYIRLNIKVHNFLNLCSMQLKFVKNAEETC